MRAGLLAATLPREGTGEDSTGTYWSVEECCWVECAPVTVEQPQAELPPQREDREAEPVSA